MTQTQEWLRDNGPFVKIESGIIIPRYYQAESGLWLPYTVTVTAKDAPWPEMAGLFEAGYRDEGGRWFMPEIGPKAEGCGKSPPPEWWPSAWGKMQL